jgi:hypothetical protein
MLYSAAVVQRLHTNKNPYKTNTQKRKRYKKLAANLPASLQQVRAMRMRASQTCQGKM